MLVYGSGLQGTTAASANVTVDGSWITLLPAGSNTISIKNGPNRLQFQFPANTGPTRSGTLTVQPSGGGAAVVITVTQAGAGFSPAAPVPIVTSIVGPQAIDVDSQGNLYITEATGANLYEWNASTQQVSTLAFRASNTFVDVAADGLGDVFALENTPDGMYGTYVQQILGQPRTAGPIANSTATQYLFPSGLCVDSMGLNLYVTTIDNSYKCLVDQFGTVYELNTADSQDNVGSFVSPPTDGTYMTPPVGQVFFPYSTGVDACGNQLTGVSGSLYGLAKDGSGFIYFVDSNGVRLNRWDPTTPWLQCNQQVNGGILLGTPFTSFTTVVSNLVFPTFNIAADLTGNIYLSSTPFSRVSELPRAYLSSTGPYTLPVGGGSQTIQILPANQNLTGPFAPVSSADWLVPFVEPGYGVGFQAGVNTGPTRTGTVTVLGVPIQVTQGESQTPAALTIISGNNQQAAVGGGPFATNLLVNVANQFGTPLANVPVTFTSPLQQVTVNTDQRGYAATTSMTAYAPGPNIVTASTGTISQNFSLTGIQSGIAVVSGSSQQVLISGLFGSLSVQVIGANGQPLVGVPVTFSAPASGASVVFLPGSTTSVTVNTGANGIASTATTGPVQANLSAGSYQVTASIAGITGLTTSSVVFNLTNLGQIQNLVGNQSAYVNNAYALPLSFKLIDSNAQPVANASVNFVVGTGNNLQPGAFFSNGSAAYSAQTDANGIATALPMTATATAGTYQAAGFVTLPNNGGTLTAGWTLTNLPSTILEGAQLNGITTRALTQPMIVQASPNATLGTMVFTIVPGSTGAGGSFNGQSSVTVELDSQRYGTSPLLTANSTPGPFMVNASDGISTVQSTITTTACLNPTNPSVPVITTSDYNPQYPAAAIPGSLRYVLANACAGSTIDLSQLSGTISLQSRLRIDDDLTIAGPTGSTLAIDGGSMTRLFFIGNGSVTMSNLTLQNGLAQGGNSVFGGGGAGMGGAIFMEGGNVTLTNVTLQGNQALGGGSGTASQCTTNCIYGGGGFAGPAVSPEQGGNSGDLFGVPGPANGIAGGLGAGAAGAGIFKTDTTPNGGNGGFAGGGGSGIYNGGLTSSGNGGFGGGGAGGAFACDPGTPNCGAQVVPGAGGYGGGSGYMANDVSVGFGGSGAGFGGAIFEYAGKLTLNTVQFLSNSAVSGMVAGLSGQPNVVGQGKGGAIFIYDGATVVNNGSTFGGNIAAAAGLPGSGNSAAPYSNGAMCPGQDTVDVCGFFGSGSAATVTINVPAGQMFSVDGVSYSGSQTLSLAQGQHTLGAGAPQTTGVGTQLAFISWSDGGAASHTITVGASGLSITGTYSTQYLLTISATAGGTTTPSSSGYYNPGSTVSLTAAPALGYVFANWTGPVSTGQPSSSIIVNSPTTVVANFVPEQVVSITVPTGVSFMLGGVNYVGPQNVLLGPGQYNLNTTQLQVLTSGTVQQTFSSWLDGGAISHTISVGSSAVAITGYFNTQYQLSASAGAGGSILPVSGFYNVGTVVNLTATANSNSLFHNWTGPVASPNSATTTVTLSQPATVTANFWPTPASCTPAPQNLTSWWRGQNDFSDFFLVNNASAGGDVSFAPGLVGQAFSFDGSQSPFVSLPAAAFPPQPGNGAFTFETWFQTSGGNGGVILGQQAGAPYAGTPTAGWAPAIYVGTDGNLYVEMFYSGTINQIVGSTPVNDNQWHHVAVTYDGGTETAYLDGAELSQVTNYNQVANGSPLSYQLGTGYTSNWPATNSAWYTFTGLIDEPAIYSRSLASYEILNLAQAGSYGKCNPVLPTTVQVGLTGGTNPSVYGQQITYTASLSGTLSTSSVSGYFSWSANAGCANTPVSVSSLTATCTTSVLPVGSDTVTAMYSGSSNYSSSSANINQTITMAGTSLPSTVSVGSSQNPSTLNQAVTFTATVTPASGSGGMPSGTVQFVIDGVNSGSPVPLSSLSYLPITASTPGISNLAVGIHTVSAVYSGDANFTSSSGSLSSGQTVVDGQNVQSVSGNNQTGLTTRTLAQPFILQTAGNPVAGNPMTFTVVPVNGAGGTFTGGVSSVTVSTDANGYATSPQLTANGTAGSFSVTGSDGSETVTFNVSTTPCIIPSVTDTSDSGNSGSLRYAVNNACSGSTIDLTNLTGTIQLGSRIRIDDSLTITGPGAANLTISGADQTRLFFIGGGTVSISGLTLANGLAAGFIGYPAGNSAGMGGAIFMNGGAVNITGVTFSGNVAQGAGGPGGLNTLDGSGFGGPSVGGQGGPGGDLFGIGSFNSANGTPATSGPGAGGAYPSGAGGFGAGGGVGGNGGFGGGGGGTNAFMGNPAPNPGTGGYGGSDGAFYGGAGAGFGGAIFEYAGTLTLVDDTFAGNSAIGGMGTSNNAGNAQGKGGALFVYSGATAYNSASTFSGNIAADEGASGIGNSAAPYVKGATCPTEDDVNICGAVAAQPPPALSVAVSSTGSFVQGGTAEWDVAVSNAAGTAATGGTVSMQDTLPAGYTLSSFGSTNIGTWSCSGSGSQTATCTATEPLAGGQSYPVIHLVANVPAGSPLSVTNTALAYGGGDPTHSNVGTAASGSSSVNVTPVAANIALGAGTTAQSAVTGTQFAAPLTVLVTDAGGNPVPGVLVTFTAPAVGASATLTTPSATDANGNASVIATANSIAGSYQVTAMISGTSAVVSFALTNSSNGTPPPNACVVTPSNLTAWWKGDDDFTDVTGAFNGSLGGDVSFAPGQVGQAFFFDGTQSPYVTLPGGAFPYPSSSAFSFETWFNTTHGGVIIGLQAGNAIPYGTPPNYTPGIYVGTDGKLYAQMFYDGSVRQNISGGAVNDGNWHHVAVTYDGSNQIAYLDGAQIGLQANFAESADGSGPYQFQLGTGYTNPSWPNSGNGWYTFNGLIDEAAVYARALTAAEVQGIYLAATYGKCDPAASFNPGTLSFGNVSEGGSATLSATVSNPGNAPLNLTAITLDAGDTSFSLLSGNPGDCAVGTPVTAGASCSIRVSFAPQALAPASGSVTVTDNSLYLAGTQILQLQGSGVAGTASKVGVVSGSGQSVAAGSPFAPLVVLVTDNYGNPVSGATVTFTAPATGPSATLGAAAPTGANGQTSVTATANSAGGTYQVTATVGGTSISTVFTLTNLTVANTLTLGPATGTSLVNTAYTVTGTYTNSSNSPVSGATVNFSVLNGPNAGKKGSGVTNSAGQATFTYAGGSTTGTDTIQASVNRMSSNKVTVTWQSPVTLNWSTPAAITYGTALSSKQLNAKASVAGTYTYTPPAGTLLTAGSQPLSVTFTPSNKNYAPATATVLLQVNQAIPQITWTPVAISYGTPLGSPQLDATANVTGTFAYNPGAGTILNPGQQKLTATFTPTDTTDYKTVTAQAALTVSKAAPVITWAAPNPISSGTPLGSAQLDATANVPGTFTYSPAAGTKLGAGTWTLNVHFVPQSPTLYTNANASVQITVQK